MKSDSQRPLNNNQPAPPRILVVEDSEINLSLAEYLIRRVGCEVISLKNGQEAVEAFSRSRFDLILMDCLLPGMDGYTATRTIRAVEAKQRRIPPVPIIALGAFAPPDFRERCLRAGMNDCFPKPLRREMLVRILKQWCPRALNSKSSQATPYSASTGTMPASVN